MPINKCIIVLIIVTNNLVTNCNYYYYRNYEQLGEGSQNKTIQYAMLFYNKPLYQFFISILLSL